MIKTPEEEEYEAAKADYIRALKRIQKAKAALPIEPYKVYQKNYQRAWRERQRHLTKVSGEP
jgi:hypothetical protein